MHPITHAQARPDHPAIIMGGSGETVTYGEMDAAANRFAHLLRSRGLEAGHSFALLMENNALFLQLVWGSQRAGTMTVPISTRLAAPEISYIMQDAGAKLLLTTPAFADRLPAIREACPECEVLVLGSGDAEDLQDALAQEPATPIEDQSAGVVMLYSSGTTGRPKGIMPAPPDDPDVQAVNPLVGLAVMGVGMPADGSMVYLSPAPLYHAAPMGWCTTVHRLGGTIVIMEKFDPENALALIEKYKVTDSQWVPTHFVRFLRLEESVRQTYDLSSHQRAIHAAAPVPVPIKQAMIDWWGPILVEYYAGSEGIGALRRARLAAEPGTVGRVPWHTACLRSRWGRAPPPGRRPLFRERQDPDLSQ